jgi:hypothetical protein
LNLKGARQQAATSESITPFYLEIRERFPNMGARAMVATLRQDYFNKSLGVLFLSSSRRVVSN